MLTLGLSSFAHDASASLLDDGVVKAAVEESKLVRSKTQGLPEGAIKYCLEKASVTWGDLDFVTVASRPYRGWMRRSLQPFRRMSSLRAANAYYEAKQLATLARQLIDLRQVKYENGPTKFKLLCLEHHLCHAAAAFYLSPYERALVVTLDEGSDGKSGMVAIGEGNQLRPVETIAFPNSLAWLYTEITERLGFAPHKEEHKTQWLGMGGEPTFTKILLEVIRDSKGPLPKLNSGFVELTNSGLLKLSSNFYRKAGLPEDGSPLSDEARCALASSLQQACFEVVRDLARHFRKKYNVENICFGGGLFQNVVLTSALERELGMNQVFVPPAPGNAGCAVGGALYNWHNLLGKPRGESVPHVYWGPSYNRHQIKDVLDNCKARYATQTTEDRRLDAAIQLLQAGKIIGWFQGAVEFGPRALGNRSLLASPWAPYVKENLNDFIKHREWFRPFAISIAEEDCERFFDSSHLCRFMNSLATLRPGTDPLPEGFALPGNQVRLHVVQEKTNPLFWRLLKRFGEVAPAPMLINTSFNMAGESLVARPLDALRSYFCSGVDGLVLDSFFLTKSPVPGVTKPRFSTVVKEAVPETVAGSPERK